VQKALNVHDYSNQSWSVCADYSQVAYSFDDYYTPQIDIMKELIRRVKLNGTNLKLLVYSGDDDSSKFLYSLIVVCCIISVAFPEFYLVQYPYQ
jgi:hypothetical protein